MLAHLQETFTERLPFELWFRSKIEDHVMTQIRDGMSIKLIAGPDDCSLDAIGKLDGGTCLCIDKKLFGINIRNLCGLPFIHQEFYRCSCRIRGIIPPGKGRNHHRIAQFWFTMILYIIHAITSFFAGFVPSNFRWYHCSTPEKGVTSSLMRKKRCQKRCIAHSACTSDTANIPDLLNGGEQRVMVVCRRVEYDMTWSK